MNVSKEVSAPRVLSVALFLLGPSLSVLFIERAFNGTLNSGEMPLLIAVVLLFWSPLFFSIPALMMQHARDAFRSEARGLSSFTRALALIPAMLRKNSGVQAEMLASLFGFVAAVVLTLPYLVTLPALLS